MCVCSAFQLRQTRANLFFFGKRRTFIKPETQGGQKGQCRRKGGKLPQHSTSVPSDLENTHDCKPREFLYKAFSK